MERCSGRHGDDDSFFRVDEPSLNFASLFEMPQRTQLGAGDLKLILQGLYEEQVEQSNQPKPRMISRAVLVNLHLFLEKFMQPRETEIWLRINTACGGDSESPAFVLEAWKLFWNAIRKVNVKKDWNVWNPFWLPNIPSPFDEEQWVSVLDSWNRGKLSR